MSVIDLSKVFEAGADALDPYPGYDGYDYERAETAIRAALPLIFDALADKYSAISEGDGADTPTRLVLGGAAALLRAEAEAFRKEPKP